MLTYSFLVISLSFLLKALTSGANASDSMLSTETLFSPYWSLANTIYNLNTDKIVLREFKELLLKLANISSNPIC